MLLLLLSEELKLLRLLSSLLLSDDSDSCMVQGTSFKELRSSATPRKGCRWGLGLLGYDALLLTEHLQTQS